MIRVHPTASTHGRTIPPHPPAAPPRTTQAQAVSRGRGGGHAFLFRCGVNVPHLTLTELEYGGGGHDNAGPHRSAHQYRDQKPAHVARRLGGLLELTPHTAKSYLDLSCHPMQIFFLFLNKVKFWTPNLIIKGSGHPRRTGETYKNNRKNNRTRVGGQHR